MMDQELAEKYIKEGGKMEVHPRGAEMNGRHAAAEQYREEAVFPYRSAYEIHIEHRDGAPSAIRDFTRLIEILEQQTTPSGKKLSPHMNAVSMAYHLRSEAHRVHGTFVAADCDVARANELEPKP